MSIPMRFELYDKDGNYLKTSGCMTRSYGSKSGDITEIRRRFVESTDDFRKYEGQNVRYVVCTEAPQYMFDADRMFMVFPNKFKANTH